MKKIIILIVIALSTTSILFAQKIPFEKFDKSRIDVGTLYVYEVSTNHKVFESSDSKEYLYIKTLDNIEIMWWGHIGDTTYTYIEKYKMNWNNMMLAKKEMQYFGDKNQIENNSTFKAKTSINFAKKKITSNGLNKVRDGVKRWSFVNKFESIPTYFYHSTDLMPLWFALRFYPFKKEKITVNSLTNNYNADVDIKYKGKEKVDVPYGKINCYKFELVPQLSFFMKLFHSPKKAFIWLTSEDTTRYMVKYINNNERSTFTQSMEYRLVKREKMTPEEWEQFKEKHGAKDTNLPKDSANTN